MIFKLNFTISIKNNSAYQSGQNQSLFEDEHTNILSVFSRFCKKFDFLVGANNSKEWLSRCNFYPLGQYDLCCAVSRKHKFEGKEYLSLEDLSDQNIMMGKRGDSDIIDAIRDMFEKKYPNINIIDTPYFYDAEVFNACEQSGNSLLTLTAWKDVHPSLITVPVKWDYKMHYGLMYSKTPSLSVNEFLQVIQNL